MALTGEAKKQYQRDLMRRRRAAAKALEPEPVRPVEAHSVEVALDLELAPDPLDGAQTEDNRIMVDIEPQSPVRSPSLAHTHAETAPPPMSEADYGFPVKMPVRPDPVGASPSPSAPPSPVKVLSTSGRLGGVSGYTDAELDAAIADARRLGYLAAHAAEKFVCFHP